MTGSRGAANNLVAAGGDDGEGALCGVLQRVIGSDSGGTIVLAVACVCEMIICVYCIPCQIPEATCSNVNACFWVSCSHWPAASYAFARGVGGGGGGLPIGQGSGVGGLLKCCCTFTVLFWFG